MKVFGILSSASWAKPVAVEEEGDKEAEYAARLELSIFYI